MENGSRPVAPLGRYFTADNRARRVRGGGGSVGDLRRAPLSLLGAYEVAPRQVGPFPFLETFWLTDANDCLTDSVRGVDDELRQVMLTSVSPGEDKKKKNARF